MKKLIFTGSVVVVVAIALCVGPAAPVAKALQFERAQTQSQMEKDMMDRQLREANKKRQQDIRNDTDKLFQLASELKAAVDKTNENLLSLEVVRKADEVEKLAKRVKEKMRDSVGPPPQLQPPPVIRPPQ
jgi:hypothetical protein